MEKAFFNPKTAVLIWMLLMSTQQRKVFWICWHLLNTLFVCQYLKAIGGKLKVKTVRVMPLHNQDLKWALESIKILPCFSKILERMMYNRLYKYLHKIKVFCNKQLRFQKVNSCQPNKQFMSY